MRDGARRRAATSRASPATGWGGTKIYDPLSVRGLFDSEEVASRHDHADGITDGSMLLYELDETLKAAPPPPPPPAQPPRPPPAGDPPHPPPVEKRYRPIQKLASSGSGENCERAVHRLFMGGGRRIVRGTASPKSVG